MCADKIPKHRQSKMMKLYSLLVMAVIVGLAASDCGKDEYYQSDICIEHCSFPISQDDRYVIGTCVISSKYKVKYGSSGNVWQNCWKCTSDVLHY